MLKRFNPSAKAKINSRNQLRVGNIKTHYGGKANRKEEANLKTELEMGAVPQVSLSTNHAGQNDAGVAGVVYSVTLTSFTSGQVHTHLLTTTKNTVFGTDGRRMEKQTVNDRNNKTNFVLKQKEFFLNQQIIKRTLLFGGGDSSFFVKFLAFFTFECRREALRATVFSGINDPISLSAQSSNEAIRSPNRLSDPSEDNDGRHRHQRSPTYRKHRIKFNQCIRVLTIDIY